MRISDWSSDVCSSDLRRIDVEMAFGIVRDCCIGCAGEANAAGERAGVYARQANAVVGLHPLIKGLDITEIAWLRHILPHNAAKGMGRVSLHILKIGADIADMGKGEVDDLPGIARDRKSTRLNSSH